MRIRALPAAGRWGQGRRCLLIPPYPGPGPQTPSSHKQPAASKKAGFPPRTAGVPRPSPRAELPLLQHHQRPFAAPVPPAPRCPEKTFRADLFALGTSSDSCLQNFSANTQMQLHDTQNPFWKPLFSCFSPAKRGRRKPPPAPAAPCTPVTAERPGLQQTGRQRGTRSGPAARASTAAPQNAHGEGIKTSATPRPLGASSPKHSQKSLN